MIEKVEWPMTKDSTSGRNWPMLERDPVIEAYKCHVDRSLIRENLRLTVEQRLEKLMRLQQFAAELRHAGHGLRQSK